MVKKGLIILGNGANLHFDLNTKWTDYWDWRKPQVANTDLYSQEDFFDFLFLYLERSKIDDNWSDVEGFLYRWFGNKGSVLLQTIARAVFDLELPPEFRKYLSSQLQINNELGNEIVAGHMSQQYFMFENLFTEYLLQNGYIAKFYEENDNYSDLILQIMALNPCDIYDIVDYNYEPLDFMLTDAVSDKVDSIYQPHGNVKSHVIIGGGSPQREFDSNSYSDDLGKWFRSQKLLKLQDYNCSWFDYTDVFIYGWSISDSDKTYNIEMLNTQGVDWPNFNSINVHVLYSVYPDFKFCSFICETYKRLSGYENGMRNAIVRTKPKQLNSRYADGFGSANSFFTLDFKEIL